MTDTTTTTEHEHDETENSLDVETPETEETADAEQEQETTEDEPETFGREYVETLRREAAEHRVRARQADDLAHRLHGSLVAATGRLADPSDLPFEQGHLDDEEALTSAIDDLLERKPHLASRAPRGNIAQGAVTDGTAGAVDLAGILRGQAS